MHFSKRFIIFAFSKSFFNLFAPFRHAGGEGTNCLDAWRLGIDEPRRPRDPANLPCASNTTPRGGVRQRLGVDESSASQPSAQASSSSGLPTSSISEPARRGGVRKRLRVDEPSSSSQGQGLLNKSMRRAFTDGVLSATRIDEIFRGAAEQGAQGCPELSSFENPQNLQRSLLAHYGQPAGSPPIQWRMIPTSAGVIPHPFMVPHAFFSSLHSAKPEFWKRSVRGPVGAAARYWASIAGNDFVEKHPFLNGVDKSRLIALGMHGDSGKFSKQDGLFVFTWNSLLGSGTTKTTKFLMTAIKKSLVTPATFEAIAQILSWSFNVLLGGLEPATDEKGGSTNNDGTEFLADGWKAVLTQIRGDWEFFTAVMGFPHWKSLDRICWLCRAVGDNNHNLRYSRSDRRAPWRRTRLTHEAFLAELRSLDLPLSPWFQFVLGLRSECVMIDVLHCADLGVFAHLVANIFIEVLFLNIWGTTQGENIAGLEALMKRHYKEQKVKNQFRGKLTLKRIRTADGWPKLKAQAATVRSLAPFCVYLAQTYLDNRRIHLCTMMHRFYELLDSEPLWMSDLAKDELYELGQTFCDLYSTLAAASFDDHIKAWKSTPKLHMFLHLCQWQAAMWGNPRGAWCYSDEDFVGRMVSVAQSCHPNSCAIVTMWKWLVGVFDVE